MDAVGGNLHRHAAAAVVAHAAEQGCQFDRAGSGVARRFDGFAVIDEDGAEQAGAVPDGLHHMMDEESGGGFAIGAGDPGDGQIAPRISCQSRRQCGQGGAAVRNMQPGDGRWKVCGWRGFRHDGGHSGGDGFGDEAVAVGAGTADGGKQASGRQFA